MLNDLVIAQVSDLHIGPSDALYRGVRIRQKFLDVLQALAKKPLDLLILSGDLSATQGEPEAYTWIKQVLSDFPYPYLIMAGNHDHVERMTLAFCLPDSDVSEGMLYYSRMISNKLLLFLDSSPYRIARRQLKWLKSKLTNYHKPVLLFIHHPPLLCDCQFMDDHHALLNIREVWKVFDKLPQIQHIFTGHYHAAKTVTKKINLFI